MKIEDIKGDFSYKENPNLRYSNENYILVIKDEDNPDKSVRPLLYVDKRAGKVENIDRYDMDKIQVPINHFKPEQSFDRFDNLYQILKISYGTIVATNYDDDKYPKCKTFANNLNFTSKEEIIEILEGEILESQAKIKVKTPFTSLISDVYARYSQPLFIETEEKIVGPFIIASQDEDNTFSVQKYFKKEYPFGEYQITDNSYIEFQNFGFTRKVHIIGFNKFDFIKEIDFKDDKEILNDFAERIKHNPALLNKRKQQEMLDLIETMRQNKAIETYLKENRRVYDILEKANEKLISDYKISEIFPEKVRLNEIIENLTERERELKSQVSSQEKRLQELQEKVDDTQNELENLTKIKEEKFAKEKSALEQEVKALTEKKANLAAEIESETQQISQQLVQLRKEKDDLTAFVDKLLLENKHAQRDAQQELVNLFKHKKYFDFLSGRNLSLYEETQQRTFTDFSITDAFDTYAAFRDKIKEILSKNGRAFETHFIDNLLIAIHQNTLTILAGLPGTGKTSLARLLTQILAPQERVTEVSVSRGWSSPKDLIGFQNPLTDKFHSAPTGVYELLEQLNYEVEQHSFFSAPLAFIILDEANLSPIEHYWSNFYNLTDTIAQEGDYLSIQLGNNHTLKYANNLRFIATINYDYTTEPLSPRVIDRTNIIQLPELNQSVHFITKEEVETLRISFQKCIEFFHLLDFQKNDKEVISFSDDENDKVFREIKELFKKLRLPISYRVEMGIKKYCSMAKHIAGLNEYVLLDYCIAQRLLPMINVQGENLKVYIDRLSQLLNENKMKISEKILDKMIEIGENNEILGGNYSYFLTLSYA